MPAAFHISSEAGCLSITSLFDLFLLCSTHTILDIFSIPHHHYFSIPYVLFWMVDQISMHCMDRSSPQMIYHAVILCSEMMWVRSLEYSGTVEV